MTHQEAAVRLLSRVPADDALAWLRQQMDDPDTAHDAALLIVAVQWEIAKG